MGNLKHRIKEEIKELWKNNKSTLIIYLFLRFLVVLCMFLEFIRGDLNNAFLCLFSLILFALPHIIERKVNVELPNLLDSIIMLFIFSAEILGEVYNMYGIIPYWDTILHTINGFLCASIGFSLVDLLNNNNNIKLSPIYLVVVAFCFSMTVGVLWEFFEFSCDHYFLNTDMQKDRMVQTISSVELNPNKENKSIVINGIEYTVVYSRDENNNLVETKIDNGYLDIGIIDTMKDLFVNFVGALVFSIFGYLYVLNRNKYKFLNGFIPRKK